MKETSIYIHIPFCDHKCIYCDFYSIINYKNRENYLHSLKKEIQYFSKLYSEGREIISIYFGGGTPSFMTPEYINEIIVCIKNNFNVNKNAEITLETNPGTVNFQKLKEFIQIGINRISIGVQSFNDDELRFLTRIHDSQLAIDTILNAYESGFVNISIDLIFNLPNQTKEKWIKNLETAVSLPVNHISAYSLIIEPGTILNKMVLDGKIKLQDNDYDAKLYEMTMNFLSHNDFIQYEVSNYAKNGYECIHNKAYWKYKDYFGFGTSAHSFINGKRWWNYSSLEFYINSIAKRRNAIAGSEELSKEKMLEEYIMLSLRSDGINLSELSEKFGNHWLEKNEKYLNEFEKEGLLEMNNLHIKLTPKGYMLCDEILLNLA